MRLLVCGAGGFIGGHLVNQLIEQCHYVRCVDVKHFGFWFQKHDAADNLTLDLSLLKDCRKAVRDIDYVYNLASSMGGMGFIENHKTECMLNVLINTHLLKASVKAGVKRFFFASSACVCRSDKQRSKKVIPLKESDSYPASPEDGYGWEKLFSERMCRHFHEDYGLETRIARFHNVYGTHGSWTGGREKAPAAITRKVIEAKLQGANEIEIWGNGHQQRSFCYIDECLEGIEKIMRGDYAGPINLGSSELVSINKLVDIAEEIAGVKLQRKYDLNAPKGVNGRNSDNSLIKALYDWEPTYPLRAGMKKLYDWIYGEITSNSSSHEPKRAA